MVWTLELAPADSAHPVFLRIARAVSADIRRGRLEPGDRLPGTRRLAERLSVHRNTVIAAFDELQAEGWLETHPGRGTFVATSLPETPLRSTRPPKELGFAFEEVPLEHPLTPPVGALTLGGGTPDLRLAPTDAIARAWRRGLRRHRHLLGYGDPRGLPRLRSALADMLKARRGLAVKPEQILVCRGSQMGLYLLARTLLRPGDHVAVEALGYPPAWKALKETGATLHPVPVDAQGIDVDALSDLADRVPLRALYITPHHQFPTMSVLPAPRRMALLALAERHRFAVLEDDYDHEFHFDGRPVLPLASADEAGVVVYIGTLSKVVAPGLRLGWVVAPQPLIDTLAARRLYVDRQGDLAMEAAVAELIEDETIPRHTRRMRRVYASRRDLVLQLLRDGLGDRVEVQAPPGGIALWPKLAFDVDSWVLRARERNVFLAAGRQFRFDGGYEPHVRLGFPALNEDELDEAVSRLVAVAP
jgi:GntR family transcriptional regulator / MocR family aminotransferase